MIQSVQIQNFKSVVDLKLELGTFNVLIGANGCGKSNILEAIAFGAAASADKLDHEFLGSREIRITNPEFMFSAFRNVRNTEGITLAFLTDKARYFFALINDSINNKKWVDRNIDTSDDLSLIKSLNEIKANFQNQKSTLEVSELNKMKLDIQNLEQGIYSFYEKLNLKTFDSNISNYILYSPEQSSLRKFEDTNQIYPLGIKGEGLFQYLKELSQDEKNTEVLNEIKECLLLLDWYEDFKLPKNLMSNEFALSIKDKYLNENLQFFDQRSTNEGFLFLLFYATLFTSKDTPKFFAIDNINTSFNPKLCMQVTKMLAELAKKHGKQVIVTTQNPAILDGLDLTDDDQRLFVVRRNEDGHTKAKRIEHKAERTMKLSEVWTNGFIGGLPDNF